MSSDQARRTNQTSTRAQGDNETYEDFAPRTEWERNEEHETLLLFLPGFNKEKLSVQLTDHGVLKISGRQPQSDGKGIRFRKDVQVPSSCDAGGVKAKFENGVLFISMPKKPTPPPKIPTPPLPETEASWPDQPPPVPDTPGDSAPTNRGVVSGDAPAAPGGGGGSKGSREMEEPSHSDDVDTGGRYKRADGGEEECCCLGGGTAVAGEEENMGAMIGGSVFGRDKKYRRKCIEIVVVAVWGLLLGLLLKRSIGSTSHHHEA